MNRWLLIGFVAVVLLWTVAQHEPPNHYRGPSTFERERPEREAQQNCWQRYSLEDGPPCPYPYEPGATPPPNPQAPRTEIPVNPEAEAKAKEAEEAKAKAGWEESEPKEGRP